MSNDYFIPGVLGKKLDLTWSQIKDRTKTGDFSGINIGDYIEITNPTNTTLTLKMRVAGIDTYARVSRNSKKYKHYIDFISSESMTSYYYNEAKDNNGSVQQPNPFLNSALIDFFKGIELSLPEDLLAVISPKYIYAEKKINGTITGYDWFSLGKFWLPMEYEIFGKSVNSPEMNGTYACQYPIFANSLQSRVLEPYSNGTLSTCWLLDSADGSNTNFCTVNASGIPATSAATTRNAIPLCFSIGTPN